MTYEALAVESKSYSTVAAAVRDIAERLQQYGFHKLRTRANFKGTRYLAEKETWVEYPDLP
jgi:DNA-binding ferritin-like protein